MHNELAGAMDVARGVLGGAVGLVLQPEHNQRRILGKNVEETEWSSVDGAIRIKRRHQRNRARHHNPTEQLVAVVRAEIVEQDSGHGPLCLFSICSNGAWCETGSHVSGGGTAPTRLVIKP